MREARATAVNFYITPADDGKAIGMAEIILVLSEPEYTLDDGGGMIRRRVLTQERFACSAATLRDIAKRFLEFADDADALAARTTIKPEKAA